MSDITKQDQDHINSMIRAIQEVETSVDIVLAVTSSGEDFILYDGSETVANRLTRLFEYCKKHEIEFMLFEECLKYDTGDEGLINATKHYPNPKNTVGSQINYGNITSALYALQNEYDNSLYDNLEPEAERIAQLELLVRGDSGLEYAKTKLKQKLFESADENKEDWTTVAVSKPYENHKEHGLLNWLFKEVKLGLRLVVLSLVVILTGLMFLLFSYLIFDSFRSMDASQELIDVVYWGNVIIALLGLFYFTVLSKVSLNVAKRYLALFGGGGISFEREYLKDANLAVRKIHRGLVLCWIGFLGLYWTWIYGHDDYAYAILFTTITTFGYSLCYSVLTSVPSRSGRSDTSVLGLVVFLLIVILGITPMVLTFIDGIDCNMEHWRLLSGLASGLALMLLAGRLDSRWIGLPVLVVPMLYLYAGIQPLEILFDQETFKKFEGIALAFALASKGMVLVVMAYLVSTGKMHSYLIRLFNTSIKRLQNDDSYK